MSPAPAPVGWSRLGRAGLIVAALALALWLTRASRQGAAAPRPVVRDPAAVVTRVVRFEAGRELLRAPGISWASRVVAASSQYGSADWSAERALGPPDVYPAHADHRNAWAPVAPDGGEEWLVVGFDEPRPVRAVLVVETLGAGALTAVEDVSGPGRIPLWRGEAAAPAGRSRVLRFDLAGERVIGALRLRLDTGLVPGWNEIDAVGLVVTDLPELPPEPEPTPAATAVPAGLRQPAETLAGTTAREWVLVEALDAGGAAWAADVLGVSSEYSRPAYGAHAALGPPDVYPEHRDDPRAWASAGQDSGEEWITVVFAAPTLASAVIVVETLGAGAVVRVDDMTAVHAPVALWSGELPSTPGASRLLRLDLPAPRPIVAVRVVLDTRRVAGWNEIDAIGIVPAAPAE